MCGPMEDTVSDNQRIYEVGYHVASTEEGAVEKVVADVRAAIQKAGGSFIAEGAPSHLKLAYPIEKRVGEKKVVYDHAHFGWLKFEAPVDTARSLEETILKHPAIIRAFVFKTVREDTRAKMKAPQLREVKRTDTIKAVRPATVDPSAAPVSEEKLDKALETLTAETA